MQMKLYRQGDVLFKRITRLPKGERKKRENATVAYGESTGHSHALAVEDREVAEVLEIGDALEFERGAMRTPTNRPRTSSLGRIMCWRRNPKVLA